MDVPRLIETARAAQPQLAAEAEEVLRAGAEWRQGSCAPCRELWPIYRRRAAWNESPNNEARGNIEGFPALVRHLQTIFQADAEASVCIHQVASTTQLFAVFATEDGRRAIGILKWRTLPTGGPDVAHLSIVAAFNDCITRRDLDGLALLMSDDHLFVDAAGQQAVGKSACVAAWHSFFAAFPHYRNVFEDMSTAGDVVTIVGRSECADARLAGPALWMARVVDGLVAAWRVHEDTPANRSLLGLTR